MLFHLALLTDKNTKEKLLKDIGISSSTMYDIIKHHMINNDFKWQEGSVYISNNKIPFFDFENFIRELFKNNKWITEYVIDITYGIVKDVNLIDFNKILNRYSKQYNKEKQNNFDKNNQNKNNKTNKNIF